MQDFPDVEGDKTVGRMTFPIYAPELSRFLTLFITTALSVFLSWFWKVYPISAALFNGLGIYVGLPYYFWRTVEADIKSYLVFNVRILTCLPRLGRPGFGSWPRMYFLCMPGRPFWNFDDYFEPA